MNTTFGKSNIRESVLVRIDETFDDQCPIIKYFYNLSGEHHHAEDITRKSRFFHWTYANCPKFAYKNVLNQQRGLPVLEVSPADFSSNYHDNLTDPKIFSELILYKLFLLFPRLKFVVFI